LDIAGEVSGFCSADGTSSSLSPAEELGLRRLQELTDSLSIPSTNGELSVNVKELIAKQWTNSTLRFDINIYSTFGVHPDCEFQRTKQKESRIPDYYIRATLWDKEKQIQFECCEKDKINSHKASIEILAESVKLDSYGHLKFQIFLNCVHHKGEKIDFNSNIKIEIIHSKDTWYQKEIWKPLGKYRINRCKKRIKSDEYKIPKYKKVCLISSAQSFLDTIYNWVYRILVI